MEKQFYDENGDYKRSTNPRIRIDVYNGYTLLWIDGKPACTFVRKIEFETSGSGDNQEVKLNLELDPVSKISKNKPEKPERDPEPLKPTWSKEQTEEMERALAAEAERMNTEEVVD